MSAPKKIPEGFHTITPSLVFADAAKAIELYKKAFGAEVGHYLATENKKIMHASLKIGSSNIFLCDANPEMGCGTPSVASFYLYVEDVDAACKKAQQAGLEEKWAPTDMFWGDRTGVVKDAFGITWTLATHVRDLSQQEIEDGRKKWMAAKKAA